MEALSPETNPSHWSKDGPLRFTNDKPNIRLSDCLGGGPSRETISSSPFPVYEKDAKTDEGKTDHEREGELFAQDNDA